MAWSKEHQNRCGAKTRGGGSCGMAKVKGRDRCRMHGGKFKRGAEHHAFKDGRSSKFMPKHLLDSYRQSLKDPDRLALDNEIAIVDARLGDLLRRVSAADTGTLIKELREKVDELDDLGLRTAATQRDLQAAAERNDRIAYASLSGQLESLRAEAGSKISNLMTAIRNARDDTKVWGQINQQIHTRRRLCESERRRALEAQEHLTYEQGMVLISALIEAVKTKLSNPDDLREIMDEFRRSTGDAPIITESHLIQ